MKTNFQIKKIVSEILKNNKDKKFHISLDVDGLDPSVAPSTGTSVKNGLNFEQIKYLIQKLNDKTVAFDIVEINPKIGSLKEIDLTINNSAKILNLLNNLEWGNSSIDME